MRLLHPEALFLFPLILIFLWWARKGRTVIVLTDRVVLDRQLQDTIYEK